jgi:DNA repair protein RecO
MQKTDMAITLRVVPFLERHKIVTAITQNYGLVSVIALNAQGARRFAANLDLFAVSQWKWSHKPSQNLPILLQTTEKKLFAHLHAPYEKLVLGCLFAQIFFRIQHLEDQNWPFFLLFSSLHTLNNLADTDDCLVNLQILLTSFLAKLFSQLGLLKDFNICYQCQSSQARFFQAQTGFFFCSDCSPSSTPFSLMKMNQLQLLSQMKFQYLITHDFSQKLFSAEDLRDLFSVMENFLMRQVPGFDKKPLLGIEQLGLRPHFFNTTEVQMLSSLRLDITSGAKSTPPPRSNYGQ